jgi:uncharacterized metal-binding protein
MPGYKTHDRIGYVSTVPISIASIYNGYAIQDTVILAIGIIVSTYYLSPDLDLNSRVFNRWGLLRWIWIPYKRVIHHRSWLSHSGPISATLRLVYLIAWITPIFYWFSVDYNDLQFQSVYVILWLSAVIADSLHVLADLLIKE